jgi:fatty-acyl-CoA synthase
LRAHPDVVDAVVVGRSSERFGSEVVAVVALRPGSRVSGADLREHSASMIARFKAPRDVVFCDQVERMASGKADYRWARDLVASTAPQAVPTGGPEPR